LPIATTTCILAATATLLLLVRGTKNGRRGGRRIMDNEYEREASPVPVVQLIESQQAVIPVLN